MERDKIIETINTNKLIVILRGLELSAALKTASALYDGGVRLVEVTFDQSGRISQSETASIISALNTRYDGRMYIGAGTVMTVEQAETAHAAGATYIISPDVNGDVIKTTRALGMVSIPGAFTPTEAASAARYGADYVKIFPCSDIKPSYIKAISAPLSHIKFLAVGGIDDGNLGAFIKAGAAGVGVGSCLVDKKDIATGNFAAITERAKKYIQAINNL